jgi:non-specific serine/threonine protein kinase
VRDDASRPLLTTLAAALHAQQLLVVLDNCEHLIEACARLVDALVRTCPRVQVLATSREALGIAGETAYRVPSLRLPTGPELPLDAVRQSEAVRLFTERAAAVQPSFALTSANAQAVVQVCQRLDGIPLALELAAARVRALSADQVAARLDHRFRLLAGGSRTALPRQQTLRATIDWSYELLTEPEQTLFVRLAAFVGGWSLEAAETICAGGGLEREDVLDLLIRLVEKSLVLTVGADSAQRYVLLETLRHYGREKLVTEGEAEALNGRHASYYLAWAEQAGRELAGSQLATRLRQLEAELDNVRAALRWSVEAGDAEWGLRVSGALSYFWYLHGFPAESRAWIEELVALPRAAARTAGRGTALSAVGTLALGHRDFAGAHALLAEALAIQREVRDLAGVAETLSTMGRLADYEGDADGGCRLLEEALSVARMTGQPDAMLKPLHFLGAILYAQGEYSRARILQQECLTLAQEVGNDHVGAAALMWLGHCAVAQGDYGAAQLLYRQSLQARLRVDYRIGIAYSLCGLANLAAAQGQHTHAVRLAGVSATLCEAAGVTRSYTQEAGLPERLAACRAALGAAAYEAAWTEGLAMPLERAIVYALEEPAHG